MTEHATPFDQSRLLGSISEVTPSYAEVTLPSTINTAGRSHMGHALGSGQVGEFVLIQCKLIGILGRVTRISLPERERLTLDYGKKSDSPMHPTATIQLLATVDVNCHELKRGITVFPSLGDKVYSCSPDTMKWVSRNATGKSIGNEVTIALGWVSSEKAIPVQATPERLFGRHCAILGATGGGKSYTLARLVEQCSNFSSKLIVIDAVGEYSFPIDTCENLSIGQTDLAARSMNCMRVSLPYRYLSMPDLFALFQPSGKAQGPILRKAITSLKLASLASKTSELSSYISRTGNVVKEKKPKKPFELALAKYNQDLHSSDCEFNISLLPNQILAECIGDNYSNPEYFGADNGSSSYCTTLVNRVEALVNSHELECVFRPGTTPTLTAEIERFLADKDGKRILRLNLRDLAFDFGTREIIANAIGRWLLKQARADRFTSEFGPLIVFLDEAHHFLDKSIGDEESKVKLDAFEMIAKEGRKYWLSICLATQQPRDIPSGVLSQMGTLIVHRLTNDRDRDVVERACGEIDRSAAAFLPTLGPGEAAIIGVDFAIPLTIQIQKPNNEPNSRGPNFQASWG